MDKMVGKVRAKDKEERNSLHSACKDGRVDVVKQLIQSGIGIQVTFFVSFISAARFSHASTWSIFLRSPKL